MSCDFCACRLVRLVFVCVFVSVCGGPLKAAESWPELPTKNATVSIPAQEWPHKPGPRAVDISIHYPDGTLASVTKSTGLMLPLHNWGGTDCAGTANPDALAKRLDVVAICVNYLQSGKQAS
ncbi:MAG: hypothetical protein O3B13_20240, partial [Planctomycetota bacterium]|nr:hypothetical protein [Planctomycetota bacterium]